MIKKNIAVIDDDTVLLNLLKVRLGHNGFEIVTADTGKGGLAMIKREKPDLIILDLVMPDLDGSVVAARLKEDRVLAKIPIFFLTGLISSEETEGGDSTIGGRRFIAKPFDAAELLEMIKEALK